MRSAITLIPVYVVVAVAACAQDPLRFNAEVRELKSKDSLVSKRKLNLFTGSSSIRMWADLERRFEGYNVLNRGFGGSHMHELFYFAPELIVDYRPKRIFIYEGDNDLGEGKSPDQVLRDAGKVLKLIRWALPRNVKVYYLTPKPSVRRWELRSRYEEYIALLKTWALKNRNVHVIDVWTPMLDKDGQLRTELFIDDGLHMNARGYDIWTEVIRPFLLKK